MKGTPFQVKVWEALLRIPEGQVTTYQEIAMDRRAEVDSRSGDGDRGKSYRLFDPMPSGYSLDGCDR